METFLEVLILLSKYYMTLKINLNQTIELSKRRRYDKVENSHGRGDLISFFQKPHFTHC
jgi:hypothetical protein